MTLLKLYVAAIASVLILKNAFAGIGIPATNTMKTAIAAMQKGNKMRITYENIFYNALREIGEMVSELYEYTDDEKSSDNIRLATLGEIRGICRFAEIMQEVLKQ